MPPPSSGLATLFQDLKFQKPPILVIVGIACAAVGLLFQIIGVASPAWLILEGDAAMAFSGAMTEGQGSQGGQGGSSFRSAAGAGRGFGGMVPGVDITVRFGLWMICVDPGKCQSFAGEGGGGGDDGNWLMACQAFSILGVLVLGACLAVGIFMCFKEDARLPLIAAATAFSSAFLILLEFAIFAAKSFSTDFGFSFAMTILAFLLSAAAGGCFIFPMLSAKVGGGGAGGGGGGR